MSSASPTGASRPEPGERSPTDILSALRSAGEVGNDLLAVDWPGTPLGEPQSWPRSLATIVRVVVSSRFSMWMAWGPELTFFCNEAYRRDTLGEKYPWALGRPAREVWAEIWDDIGPRIETVLTTGTATWDESLLLFLQRSGYSEETYHTFSYSPLSDDDGVVAGMLCVVSEDTERVIGARHMATLRDLGAEPTTGRDERTYLEAATSHLAANGRSLPFTLTYLFGAEGEAELVCSSGIAEGHPAAPRRIRVNDGEAVWPVGELAGGRPLVVRDLDRRTPKLPAGPWREPPTTAVVLPLRQAVLPEHPYGFLVAGLNRYRPLDEGYLSFLELVAAQLASGVASTRAYEAERRRAEELAELDRAKTAFFTNVSHELRTPLTLLLGPAEDALAEPDSGLSPQHRQRLEMIARNGQRLLKLVNTLLDFSRLESGRAQGAFEPVDLADYTTELAGTFESAASRAGLSFEIDCPPLPEAVWVDREMWAKLVLNLLSNALKFTFEGGITVRLRAHEGRVRLMIGDTGIGIDPAEQPRLFERFHRVQGVAGRTYEGSGIGLALVAELAGKHGGEVSVDSQPGRGSTFTVELPMGSDHLPADQLARDGTDVSVEAAVAGFLAEVSRWLGSRPDEAGTTAARAVQQLPRVLVVDDNADMREYLAAVLAGRYDVSMASDGQTALEAVRRQPPDLVLTDVMMPRLDGFGLLAALQSDPATMHIPVVMLSARAGDEGVVEGLEAGADDYLIKPFTARELLARVQANLELERARRTRQQLERGQRLLGQAERLAEMGSWEIEVDSGRMQGSAQLLHLLGVSAHEFQGMRFEDTVSRLVHSSDREMVRRNLKRALATGASFEYELRMLTPASGTRWMRVRGEVLLDADGKPEKLRGFLQDITQRRAAEQALAAAAAARKAAEREHEIADALQRSLLPAHEVRSDHLEVATYYQAGVEGTHVGGDWYDTLDLGAGRVALVVGDVAGRGVRAASVMGQLRAAVRAYARLDLPPAEVLELLDAMVYELTDGQLVTCVFAVYDPVESELRYASAGHLPPILTRPDGSSERIPGATGPPLGLGSCHYEERRLPLSAGTIVTFYTDGLVERRGRDLDDGIAALVAAMPADARPLAQRPDALVRALAPDGSEDDIAILMARIGEVTEQRTAVLEVAPEARAIAEARRFAAVTLRDWAVPEQDIEDAGLIVSELLTNAILHGRPPVRLRLLRTARELAIEVDDGAPAMPRRLNTTPEDAHGRGLAIVADVSARWAARPKGHGKTVWSTLALRR